MDREIIRQTYNGYLNNEAIEQKIEEYLNILKNNEINKELNNTHLIVATENKEQALDFANNTAKFLCSQIIEYSFKKYDLNENNISDLPKVLENIVVVNNFDEYIKWEDIKNLISSTDKIIILCTTLSNENRYKEDKRDFYELFVKQIELEPYSIDDICSASKIFFEGLKRSGKILSYDESFFLALDEYIRTVYPRAILQGRAFVEDLETRIIRRAYETNTPLELSDKTIPYYFKQEGTDEILNNIKEYFCFSSDIDAILKNVSDCAKLKHARGFTEYKPTLNLNLSGYSFEYVERFANIYARLLNSDKYNLIHSKNVTIMNLYDVMREKDNFNNKHGLILLKDFDLVKDFLNANEVVAQLIEIINNQSNDLAWILYGHHKFEEMLNIENVTKLNSIFDCEYSLDECDDNSSKEYIKLCFKNITFDNKPILVPSSLDEGLVGNVKKSQNQKEAKKIIEEYIANNIEELSAEDETPKIDSAKEFDGVQRKESEICKLVENIKHNPNKNEVNILLLAMSTINFVSVSTYTYKDENYDIEGKYVSSLEPVPKMLAEILAKKDDKLDAIYVLNTQKTTENLAEKSQGELIKYANTDEKYTAFSYFKERCSCLIDSNNIYSINLENNEKQGTNVEAALYEVSQKLNAFLNEGKEINLYVDIHGGLRAPQIIVDAILMLIKDIEHIKLKDIYTGAFNGEKFPIVSVKSDFEIFNFVSGMREFLSFGRSNGLVEFNKARESQSNQDSTKLVDGINRISDSIVLNRMEKFEDNLISLSELVNTKDREKGFYDTIKNLIRSNYQVSINNKRYDLLDKESINFPAQLQWCLDKNLLQQALMLIENRTSNALENTGILEKKSIKRIKRKKGKIVYKKTVKLDLFGNWIKYSLALEESKWEKKGKGKNNDELETYDNEKILCYKPMNQYELFGGIKFTTTSDVREEIKSKKIKSDEGENDKYPTEYFNCAYDSKEDYYGIDDEFYVKKDNYNSMYARLEEIPINDKLKNNQNFLESFYTLLYVYKNLKWYRNTVAHPEKIDNDNDLKVEELRAWIKFYIEIFTEALDKANTLFVDANERPSLDTKIIKEEPHGTNKK